MKQTTFTEVRNHAKHYFDLVEAGESVRILRNGKPIADIVPITCRSALLETSAPPSRWCWMACRSAA